MSKKKRDEEDEDEGEEPFDFFNFFKDPNKLFKSKQFEGLFQEIFDKILKNLPPEFKGLSPEDIKKEFMKNKERFGFKGPIMYGFNVNIGSDGKPKIDSFGNIKKKSSGKPRVKEVREPLVEVSEEEDQIIIIAEMPGITKEDIEIKATSHSLILSANSKDISRNYHKEVELPVAIDSNIAKARYQNGLLEIKLKKIKDEQTNIKID